ncbi:MULTISPECIES: conjugal transfer protein MobB [Bacteroidota]|uniref:Relaxase/Mobilisation nuclease domain-containing protein n=1 Tax=Sphingobacterium psychroaquaticum TaxID=561061 RepID=A0A1X7J783_9SPHI|nr:MULTISPECIES: conjugal transfer protein MobB [Bacteroidota]EHM7981321.1 relaxase/mobilization nuclease domain-containing protein [Elizabethkingia anophelis]EHM8032924.1 relaxase/mobilization nuclease domain-containing protein [Elizabethkingia anophelis]EHZ9535909.1 relaxase/mobilization nuclease domain-containing protein [Elizabethkingia anophelis]EKU3673818.1 relaxase/mobilization nuclease domain-containing protein [Elizabethkingia anophelis]EKU4210796.1 relaxase/mobilization nuclease doma
MIAKIGRSGNLYGALAYNQLKVENENGKILFANKIIETPTGAYTVAQLAQSFAPYLIANRNTEKHTLHISLNPDPKDKVSDDRFRQMAEEYMREMGYGEQPFVVFKHTDIDRSHIHIVSVCVDEQGKKISDKFEKMRSMNVCRELERQHGLIPATDKEHKQNDKIFRPVDYRAGDVKSQIASVVRHLPNYYKFQTLGEYNALLSLFNVTTEKVEGELQGKMRQGLLYIPLNEKGERAGHPFKASLFGKNAGLPALELHFAKCKEDLKDHPSKQTLKAAISIALKSTNDEQAFKKQLSEQGINVVVRRNDTGRIYGITFIDHNSKAVWNGSRLAKELSANTFNDYWNNNIKPEIKEPVVQLPKTSTSNDADLPAEEPHHLFDFLNTTEKNEDGLIEAFGGLLPEAQGDDYEEQDFANKMKKKKKRRL